MSPKDEEISRRFRIRGTGQVTEKSSGTPVKQPGEEESTSWRRFAWAPYTPNDPRRLAGPDKGLYEACIANDLTKARIALGSGARPSFIVDAEARESAPGGRERTPLMIGAANGYTPIVDLLLHAGANVNERTAAGISALTLAASLNRRRMVEHLMERGAAADILTLHYALESKGGASLLRVLSALGADLNARDRIGRTLLHTAAQRRDPRAVGALLSAGADPNARDEQNATPGHHALGHDTSLTPEVIEGIAAVLNLLLDAGADPDLQDRGGRSIRSQLQLYPELEELVTLK